MPKKLPLPPRVTRSSDAFRVPGASYDPEQVKAADAYNDILRKRVYADNKSGRADDAYYDVADARELEEIANIPERSLRPTAAKRELLKRSKEGEFAAPGQGDQGQFLKKGGKVSSASSRGDGIAKRGKTKGRMC